jgi:hypothetical protein
MSLKIMFMIFKRLDYIDEEQISSIVQGKLISHFVIFQHVLSCPKLCIVNRDDQSTIVFFFLKQLNKDPRL